MFHQRPSRLKPSKAILEEDVSLGLGEVLHDFQLSDLAQPRRNPDADIRLAEFEAVSSYSWVNESGIPMIAVPGMPPIWSEPSVGELLPWDKSNTVAERQNADTVPKYPLLALVASIRQERPDYALSKVDIVTARNSLRRLLRWIRSSGNTAWIREFRVDVDVAGDKTILLTRRELRANEPHIKNAHGHGLAFERAATRDERDGTAYMPFMGHHRIVKYRLEGITMLVRSEVDACVQETPQATPGSPAAKHLRTTPSNEIAGVRVEKETQDAVGFSRLGDLLKGLTLEHDELSSSPGATLSDTELSNGMRSPTSTLFSFYEHPSAATSVSSVDISHLLDDDTSFSPREGRSEKQREPEVPVIRVLAEGRQVAQRDLVELTTCFDTRFPRWDELCDQLFLSGVQRVHVGFYDKVGAISTVRKYTPGYYRMAMARKKQAESYRQLAELLRQVRQRVMEHPGMKLSLACVNGRLGLYERLDGTVALPAKYLKMFD